MTYEYDGYFACVSSLSEYFTCSMELLDPENAKQIFIPKRSIYTKVSDNAPAKYDLNSIVNNSLVADGCIIEGTVENCILPSVMNRVIILEGVTLLVLKENAGHMADGKGIMVAIAGQLATVQALEIMFSIVQFFEQGVATHSLIAHLAVLHRVVVANHVDVEQILDLRQRHNRMLRIIL